jgi:D-alanyl-lipoteichoic acid acyltransferase DltB (MBOAT superfamily)
MGIELNVNFLFPYLVVSPQEFWRNWHISLSTWLRDYLYIPLGGNRGGAWLTRRNVMITMLLGGLWHGAAWTFVLWGLYQGLLLVIYRPVAPRLNLAHGWRRLVLGVLMFHLTCLGWLIFRAASVQQIALLVRSLIFDFHTTPQTMNALLVPMVRILTPLLVVHLYQAHKGSELAVLDLPRPVRYALYGAVFYCVLLFGDFQGAQFIYFQF